MVREWTTGGEDLPDGTIRGFRAELLSIERSPGGIYREWDVDWETPITYTNNRDNTGWENYDGEIMNNAEAEALEGDEEEIYIAWNERTGKLTALTNATEAEAAEIYLAMSVYREEFKWGGRVIKKRMIRSGAAPLSRK